jgi:DNA-binding NtrC family response regulator
LTLKHLAGRVSKSNATVLIRGESGTGKELLARGIHANSMRRNGPFVTVDCASIPESLIESTLFGHVRGAFTGAVESRVGLVGSADGGSLFLDEIGELPLPMQAKLLRTLQFGTFTPVGSTQEQKVDVRILVATHRDLAWEAQDGGFRTDLYYRLSVLELVSPPLRDRHGDITHLAKIFVERIAARDQIPAPTLTEEALEVLNAYRWPGNLRELQNVMERVVCLTTSSEIGVEIVGQAIEQRVVLPSAGSAVSVEGVGSVAPAGASVAGAYTHQDFLSNNERLYIEELLRRHRGNVSRAAKEAKMSRQGLHKALLRLGINASNYRAN